MDNADLNALRLLLREEVNAAVYASEQRLGDTLRRIETDVLSLKTDVSSLTRRVEALEISFAGFRDDLLLVKKDIVTLKRGFSEVEGNLSQVISVLDEVTTHINELQVSQRNVEIKVDENILGLKKEMQKLAYRVQAFMDNVNDAIAGVTMRIDMHKDTPLNQAHPNSAA
ncbi:MAG TPA: hypothetical protein VKV20_07070 [Ktedonobacteraceae bacterium]|jgi:chromosome segregation ATPase|nr:hypothetical protein [Ktedonobacteraceae bacterium]